MCTHRVSLHWKYPHVTDDWPVLLCSLHCSSEEASQRPPGSSRKGVICSGDPKLPRSSRIVSALFSSFCEDTWASDCLRTLVDFAELILGSISGLWPVRLHGSPHSPFSPPSSPALFKSATSKQNTRDYNIQIKWQYTWAHMQSDSNYTNTGKRNANTSSSIPTGLIIFFILFNTLHLGAGVEDLYYSYRLIFLGFLFCFVFFPYRGLLKK